MGLCVSRGGAAAAAAEPRKATAMVLLPTGELREYPRPATAARALQEAEEGGKQRQRQGWFLCDADGMGYEGPVSAVPGGEQLRPGQIYFVLPAEARRRGLRREDVAALAVKASAALGRAAAASGTGRRRRGTIAPLVFSTPPEEEKVTVHKTAPPAGKGRARRTHRRFASDLTAIPECEVSE